MAGIKLLWNVIYPSGMAFINYVVMVSAGTQAKGLQGDEAKNFVLIRVIYKA